MPSIYVKLGIFLIFACSIIGLSANPTPQNSSEPTTNTILPSMSTNLTQLFEEKILKLVDRCLSDEEVRSLYGNKSQAPLVMWFIALLVRPTFQQIGWNELRHRLNLKTQSITIIEHSVEEPADKNLPLPIRPELVQEKARYGVSSGLIFDGMFTAEEIDEAERVFDRVLPEVRECFQIAYKRAFQEHKWTDEEEALDELVHAFRQTRIRIIDALATVIAETRNTDIAYSKSKCYLRKRALVQES